MTRRRRLLLSALGVAALTGSARADGERPDGSIVLIQAAPPATPAPPVAPAPPTPPAALPTPPTAPPQAPAMAPAVAAGLQNVASARGTQDALTAYPTVFGDLFGYGFFAGPIAGFSSPSGTLAGPPIFTVNPATGRRTQIAGPMTTALGPATAQDELIRNRAAGVTGVVSTQGRPGAVSAVPTPGSVPVAIYPAPGTVFDPSLAGLVARFPEFVRGAFKITENDTPRPTSRAYLTYNFYDQLFNSISGPNTPRLMLHQEVFGLEYAFADQQYSVAVRLPYNQVVSNQFFNSTSLGDITLIGKAVLLEDRETGDLLSGGLALTVPSGDSPFGSTLTGTNPRGTLVQPWVGHILTWDRLFVQGFDAVVVPTSGGQPTFLSHDAAAGYFLYRDGAGLVTGVIPTVEAHLNVPVSMRGTNANPVGFVDTLTLLGGAHALIRQNGSVGVAVGSPITGPRPFSLQATVQFNLRY
jgi:hypothetical protein